MIVFFSRTQKLTRKITMIGSIGKSLTLYSHTVVVIVRTAAFALGTSSEPVTGIYLSTRLGGKHLKHPAALGGGKHSRFPERVFVPVVKHPAVIVALAYLQGLEIGVDIAAYGLGCKKSIGVSLTSASSPVGICVESVGRYFDANS